MFLKKLQFILSAVVLVGASLSLGTVSANGAVGYLSCMDATTSSNLIYIEFSGAGTTGANLYRYGAAHAIATYPNRDSGKGSFNDTGLNAGSTYQYTLMSGPQVIATKNCTTQVAAQPAPAPAPTPAPSQPPGSPPPSSNPAPAPTPNPQPAAQTTTTPALAAQPAAPAPRRITQPAPAPTQPVVVEPTPTVDPTFDGQTDTPTTDNQSSTDFPTTTATPQSKSKPAKAKSNIGAQIAIGAAIILAMVVGFFIVRRFRNSEPEPEQVYNYYNPELSPDLPLPATPEVLPPAPSNSVEQSINEAFYPNTPMPAPATKPKTDEPADMYEIASRYPASFGNVHYADSLDPNQSAKKPAEPSGPLRLSSQQEVFLHPKTEPTDPYTDRTSLK